MNTKDFKLEVKELTDAGEFTGYASVYGNTDLGGDAVMPGAFTKTIQDRGNEVPLCWQHDLKSPIGKGRLEDTSDGLVLHGRLTLGVPLAMAAHALMKDEVIKGLSIGYKTVKDEMQKGIRLLRELKLYEVSLVTVPMNPEAQITSVKQFDQLMEELKAGRVLSATNVEALRAAISDGEVAISRLRTLLEVAEPQAPAEKGAVHPSDEPSVAHSFLTDLSTQLLQLRGINA